MPRAMRSELPESFYLAERYLVVAGEIKQRVQQHRTVAVRQHKTVAVRPRRVGGVELQVARE